MKRMKLHLPWVTLTGTPDGPGFGPKAKCFGAMLLHEVVELTVGSQRAHSMRSCQRYAVEAVAVIAGAAEAAAGAGEVAAAGAGAAEAAGAGEAAATEAAVPAAEEASSTGQIRNLNGRQFAEHMMKGGGQIQLNTRPDYTDPHYTS